MLILLRIVFLHGLHAMERIRSYPTDFMEQLESFRCLSVNLARGSGQLFERTAVDLGVDPSVLRRRLYALDRWFGAPLLMGRGNRIELSAVGQSVLKSVRRVGSELTDLRRRVHATVHTLSIADASEIEGLVARAAAGAVRSRPTGARYGYQIVPCSVEDAILRLMGGESTLALLAAPRLPIGFEGISLCAQKMLLVEAASSATGRQSPTKSQLERLRLIMPREPSAFRTRILSELGPLDPRFVMSASGMLDTVAFVQSGLGTGLVAGAGPLPMIPSSEVRVRDVSDLFAPVYYFLVWNTGVQPSDLSSAFCDTLRAQLKQ